MSDYILGSDILGAVTNTLKKGSKGVEVREVQEALTKAGYDTKGIDGDYGKNTVKAVEKFQKEKKLKVDGIVGPETIAALGVGVPVLEIGLTPNEVRVFRAAMKTLGDKGFPTIDILNEELAKLNIFPGTIVYVRLSEGLGFLKPLPPLPKSSPTASITPIPMASTPAYKSTYSYKPADSYIPPASTKSSSSWDKPMDPYAPLVTSTKSSYSSWDKPMDPYAPLVTSTKSSSSSWDKPMDPYAKSPGKLLDPYAKSPGTLLDPYAKIVGELLGALIEPPRGEAPQGSLLPKPSSGYSYVAAPDDVGYILVPDAWITNSMGFTSSVNPSTGKDVWQLTPPGAASRGAYYNQPFYTKSEAFGGSGGIFHRVKDTPAKKLSSISLPALSSSSLPTIPGASSSSDSDKLVVDMFNNDLKKIDTIISFLKKKDVKDESSLKNELAKLKIFPKFLSPGGARVYIRVRSALGIPSSKTESSDEKEKFIDKSDWDSLDQKIIGVTMSDYILGSDILGSDTSEFLGAVTNILKKGSKGAEVREVQEALTKAGYDTKGIDGDFGKNTEKAVEKFQKEKKLKVDGIVGPETIAALGLASSDWAALLKPAVEAASVVTITPIPSTPVTITPISAAPTSKAPYLDKPLDPYAKPLPGQLMDPYAKIAGELLGAISRTLKKGDKGEDVKELQRILTTAGFDTGGADGDFGNNTEKAVKKFQESRGLPADGIVGDKTISVLNAVTQSVIDSFIRSAQAATSNLAVLGAAEYELLGTITRTLKKGDRGVADVKELQQALTKAGYSTKGIDGDFGNNTENAVKAFQKAKGLTVDGIVGPATLAALFIPEAQPVLSISAQPGSAANPIILPPELITAKPPERPAWDKPLDPYAPSPTPSVPETPIKVVIIEQAKAVQNAAAAAQTPAQVQAAAKQTQYIIEKINVPPEVKAKVEEAKKAAETAVTPQQIAEAKIKVQEAAGLVQRNVGVGFPAWGWGMIGLAGIGLLGLSLTLALRGGNRGY